MPAANVPSIESPRPSPEPHGLANDGKFEPEPHGLANDGKYGPTNDWKFEPEPHAGA